MDHRARLQQIVSRRAELAAEQEKLSAELRAALIAAREADIRPAALARITGLTPQRLHQIINGTR